MSRIKNDFNKPVTEQIAISRDRQTKMTGNPNFANPDPKLEDIKAATDELEDANNAALNNDKEKKALMRIKRKALVDLMRLLAAYVQQESGGDEAKILSAGFGVVKLPAPANAPATPVKVLVKAAVIENELDITWKAVKGAKSYFIEWALNTDFSEIKGGGIVTKARFSAKNLEAGTKYWFRVGAINAAGNSGWSEPASGRTL